MKRALSSALVLAALVMPALAYVDIPENQWYTGAVYAVTKQGLMGGTGDNKFSPDSYITWAQVAQVLYGEPNKTDGPWYTDAVNWAPYQIDDPGANITRADTMSCFYVVAGSPDTSLEVLSKYMDVSKDNKALAWAVNSGLLSGTSANTLAPDDLLTRAQFAAILSRYSPAKPTQGKAPVRNANGFYTYSTVDITGARLRYDMLDAINTYLTSLGLAPTSWVSWDEMEEYTLCRAKEAYTLYSHTRPLGKHNMKGVGECLMKAKDCSMERALREWQNSPTHNELIVDYAPGNQICVAEYDGSWALTVFINNKMTAHSATNYYASGG